MFFLFALWELCKYVYDMNSSVDFGNSVLLNCNLYNTKSHISLMNKAQYYSLSISLDILFFFELISLDILFV